MSLRRPRCRSPSSLPGPSAGQDVEPDSRHDPRRGPRRPRHHDARSETPCASCKNPACQQLLDDFTDREGRPLRERLGSSTPDAYLARLVLRDGEIPKGSRRCASPGAAAFTAGGAAVFVCGTSFRTLSRTLRENALIHEMLHTLGLRENPPSSAEISRRVAERCGG